ncbi:MAG: metal-dependent transcriptional regulator [Saprospiraceae bacterium]
MPSQTKENYLKALFSLSKKTQEISLTDLSKELEVSIPTANNMVKKLKEHKWVNYQKYKPLSLTDEGRRMAAIIVRKHRLTEMFLSRLMGFGWEEVHDIAEQMEHIKSEKLFERMDELLGFPTVDPHGSPIPKKDGTIEERNYKKLSECQEGATVILKALENNSQELLHFLNRKNLMLGATIRILSIEPFDLSIFVSYYGNEGVMLSKEVSERLLVEQLD